MPISSLTYNLDGAMTAAAGEPFSEIRRHNYTRLPVAITGVGGSISLRYDSFGRRLHKTGAQTIFYRSGAHHPASDRTKELEKGDEIHHTLVELVGGAEVVYIFTPAGQTILRREHGYARIARDHLRSVRAEISNAAQITAHYSAYGKSIITGGELRRAFAGYEPDTEVGLYNANRRLYAPTLRLFVSVDPRLQDASPYPYCANDPFNRIDPTGGISSATISSIVMALVLVITIAADIASGGILSELFAPEAAAEAGGGSGGTALAAVTEVGAADGETVLPSGYVVPSKAVQDSLKALGQVKRVAEDGFFAGAKMGATIGAASSVASNGAELVTKAVQGEHITAWQAIKSMIIKPAVAAVAGGFGGGVAGYGLASDIGGVVAVRGLNSRLLTLGTAVVGGAGAGGTTSVANTALDGNITTRSGWEQIGIQMAIAAGEALILSSVFLRPRASTGQQGDEWNRAATTPGPMVKAVEPKIGSASLVPGEKLAPIPEPGTVEVRPVRLQRPIRGAGPPVREDAGAETS